MQDIGSGKILGITDNISNFWYGISISNNIFAVLDILIIAAIIYWAYILIKETRAIRILYGILFLALIMIVGQVFQLSALNWLLSKMFTMILVAIPVVFQPELRSALERLGRTKIVGNYSSLKKSQIDSIVSDLVESSKILSRNKTGALVVITQKTGLRDIIDTGTPLDARLTPNLLLTIFAPNTPLHDGAVILSGNKIIAASCTLPLSEDEFNFNIGTRHRAAVGMSSQSDAIVLVVSEETGAISISYNGNLSKDISPKELEELLLELLLNKHKKDKKKIIKESLE